MLKSQVREAAPQRWGSWPWYLGEQHSRQLWRGSWHGGAQSVLFSFAISVQTLHSFHASVKNIRASEWFPSSFLPDTLHVMSVDLTFQLQHRILRWKWQPARKGTETLDCSLPASALKQVSRETPQTPLLGWIHSSVAKQMFPHTRPWILSSVLEGTWASVNRLMAHVTKVFGSILEAFSPIDFMIFVDVTKYSRSFNLKKERFLFPMVLRTQSNLVERHQWQEHEGSGHILSTIRKQRKMGAGAQLAFSFLTVPYSVWTLATEKVSPTSSVTDNFSRNILTDTPRGGMSPRWLQIHQVGNGGYQKIPINRNEYTTEKGKNYPLGTLMETR